MIRIPPVNKFKIRHELAFIMLFIGFAIMYGLGLIYIGKITGKSYIDEFLIILTLPVFYAAYTYRRRVYFTCSVFGFLITCYVLLNMDVFMESSFRSLIAVSVVVLFASEFIHQLRIARQKMIQALEETSRMNQRLKEEISERKRLKERTELLSIAVEQAAESIVVTDVEGTIQYVNTAFEKMTGYKSEEAIGKKANISKSDKHEPAFYKRIWDTITSGKIWTGHIINKRRDGTLYEIESTISPVRDESGKIINYVAVMRDVTLRMALEAELRLGQKMKAIDKLASGVAHDFNNLLAGIIGNLSLAERKVPNEFHKYIVNAKKASERAADLVRQLLSFSRLSKINRQPTDINSIIQQTYNLARQTIDSCIEINVEMDSELPTILADSDQINSAIMKLCLNSRDAIMEIVNGVKSIERRQDHFKITLQTMTEEITQDFCQNHTIAYPGHYVVIKVIDNGPGMDRETIEQIFEPFFTTKEVGQGKGLGLASAYGIIKQHKGWIDLESEYGLGTTFNIYLPVDNNS